MKEFYNFVIYFDSVSPGPELVHRKSKNFGNLLGVIFTALSVAVTIYTIKDDLTSFFERRDPITRFGNEYTVGKTFNASNASIKVFVQIKEYDLLNNKFKALTIDEIQSLTGGKKLNYPHVGISNISYFDIINQDIIVPNIGAAKHVELSPCSEEFFSDFNDHLYYDQFTRSKSAIETIRKSSLCMPDYVTADLVTEENWKVTLSFIFGLDFYQAISAGDTKNKAYAAVFTYQVFDMNLEPKYFNKGYYKKVWEEKEFIFNPARIEGYVARIQETKVKKSSKFFLFDI